MKFEEAIQAMKQGKKVKLPELEDYLVIINSNFCWNGDKRLITYIPYERVIRLDWEVVDDECDWNLADEIIKLFNQRAKWITSISEPDVMVKILEAKKKCRDLILEDLEEYKDINSSYEYQVEMINKRFGDL